MPPPAAACSTAALPQQGAAGIHSFGSSPRSASSSALDLLRKIIAFAGPGYLVAVGYMDPGNWATDIAGGSKFGYMLMPVIVMSSLAAVFLQWMALRLGIATRMDL